MTTQHLLAIALTVFTKEEDRQVSTASASVLQRHPSKPITPDELVEVVTNLAKLLR
jgi:CheY-like chemotaxis protein